MKLTNFNQIQQIALQKVSANRAAEFKTATTLIEPQGNLSKLESAASTPLHDPFKGRRFNLRLYPLFLFGYETSQYRF